MLADATKKLLVLALLAACAGGCANESGRGEKVRGSSQNLSFPAGEVELVLGLVNDPATNFALLDDDVRLDRRAAANIVERRNGPDGVYPSADDDRFDDLEELDAVPYVGVTALMNLRDYAVATAPAEAELVEGVQFTGEQAAAVVWGVNQASVLELDDEVGLSRRAAENLVAEAPYASVTEMGFVSYVGPSALAGLRDHAVVWNAARGANDAASQAGTYDGVAFDEATAEAALAIANVATYDQLNGEGSVYSGGARTIVDNRPYSTLAEVAGTYGVGPSTMRALHDYASSGGFVAEPEVVPFEAGEQCDDSAPCVEGYLCMGITVYGYGYCNPEWMAGTFESTDDAAIPDADGTSVTSSIVVDGLASVPEDVIVHLDIDHPRVEDLRVVLVGPSSGDDVLWEYGSAGEARISALGIERDADVNGVWTLIVTDSTGGSAGTLRGWSLELTSRFD